MVIKIIKIIFNKEYSIRVDKFLSEELSEYTRSEISKFIDNNCLKINGSISKKSTKLILGDVIELSILSPKTSEIIPQKMNLKIIYEDNDIILIDKEQGIVVHPGAGNSDMTLVNGLLYYCKDLKGIGGVLRPGVVHRIDKDTTGILVFAKNQYSLNYIANQFKLHTNIRKYLTIIRGIPDKDEGRIDNYITRDPNNRLKFTSKLNKGKRAITNYKILEKFNYFSLVEVTLETGRTHQIRVHFSDMNHPIIGDPLYGYGIKNYKFLPNNIYSKIKQLKGQLLHAKYLEFEHPTLNKRVKFEVKPHLLFLEFLDMIRS